MTSNGSNVSLGADSFANWPVIESIDLYVTPVWYVLGIPGNILAFIVWVQRRMRPSSGCYLAALALDECLFLFMQVEPLSAMCTVCSTCILSVYLSLLSASISVYIHRQTTLSVAIRYDT